MSEHRIDSLRSRAAAHRAMRDVYARMGDVRAARREEYAASELDIAVATLMTTQHYGARRAAPAGPSAAAWMACTSVHSRR